MKAIMVMFDSLNRHFLPNYGNQWVKAPNFRRLANQAVTFDQAWIGSMPCMPARRELHTGRYNFLHRSWGPLEPFDDSAPDLLKNHGIYSHHVTDHQHYFEDGGATYHERYSSWEFARGQEGDPWKGQVEDPTVPAGSINQQSPKARQDWVNRSYMRSESAQPQAQTFDAGLEFIRTNASEDHWFLQIETFDPHEPFFAMQQWKDKYLHGWVSPHFDWPKYERVREDPKTVAHVQYEYAALLSQCDHYLGQVLNYMDDHHMWSDTMLIVNTDHGFLLGEHDWWAKCRMPFYNEIARTPFFIWDPRIGNAGERRRSITQMMDLPATLLEFFGVEIPKDMIGMPLRDVISEDIPIREFALFGIFGGHVNITNGRYVYMRSASDGRANKPLFHYTQMPTHIDSLFSVEEMKTMTKHPGFSFTKNTPVMKIDASLKEWWWEDFETMLFDLKVDPGQKTPLANSKVEKQMVDAMTALMKSNDAPSEQFERPGLL